MPENTFSLLVGIVSFGQVIEPSECQQLIYPTSRPCMIGSDFAFPSHFLGNALLRFDVQSGKDRIRY